MSQNTAIGWTEATWNPVTGCSHVSPGCVNCYAEKLSLRFGRSTKPWTAQNAAENVVLHPDRLRDPVRWRKPKMVFVNSMSDLFHERIPDEFIDKVFGVMAFMEKHTFQILTKRPERMQKYLTSGPEFRWGDAASEVTDSPCTSQYVEDRDWPLPNVWLGVSVEDQRRANERVPALLETPAAVRFISAEPLLDVVDVQIWLGAEQVSWVIVGGESGPHHRPMQVEWAQHLVDQCWAEGVACFVKQDSGSRPGKQGRLSDALWARKEYPVGRGSEERETT